MFTMASFLALIVAALGQRAHLADDFAHALLGVAGFAQLDEVRVLGQAAGVEVERGVVLGADLGDLAHVGQRYRLPATRVVGDGEHDERDAVSAVLGERLTQARDVHVALEGVVRVHVGELGRGEVERDARRGTRRWRAWCRSGCCWARRRPRCT